MEVNNSHQLAAALATLKDNPQLSRGWLEDQGDDLPEFDEKLDYVIAHLLAWPAMDVKE